MQYDLQGSVLVITGELSDVLDMQFDLYVSSLLEQPDRDVIIDLTGVSYMASQYLGALAAIAMEASKAGKELTVRASDKVAKVIQLAGFDRILSLELN